ncbi:hypothetical protein Sarmat_00177 [Rickettsiales endosymbiont of Paramecium tredecaurelia]|uniref:hypothetical protein n=1 Tax=Candidatus Sarmatiella mevalonica TaxID=2770581 RepID=UPI001922CD1B|nr:hypothetical protein [Candidatus Sarmatiella mevalonica]MBL3284337.1 hypothetical protein [Candidatus Sarmatiella mevalonica]
MFGDIPLDKKKNAVYSPEQLEEKAKEAERARKSLELRRLYSSRFRLTEEERFKMKTEKIISFQQEEKHLTSSELKYVKRIAELSNEYANFRQLYESGIKKGKINTKQLESVIHNFLEKAMTHFSSLFQSKAAQHKNLEKQMLRQDAITLILTKQKEEAIQFTPLELQEAQETLAMQKINFVVEDRKQSTVNEKQESVKFLRWGEEKMTFNSLLILGMDQKTMHTIFDSIAQVNGRASELEALAAIQQSCYKADERICTTYIEAVRRCEGVGLEVERKFPGREQEMKVMHKILRKMAIDIGRSNSDYQKNNVERAILQNKTAARTIQNIEKSKDIPADIKQAVIGQIQQEIIAHDLQQTIEKYADTKVGKAMVQTKVVQLTLKDSINRTRSESMLR